MARSLTASLPGEPGGSGSWNANCLVSLGLGRGGRCVLRQFNSSDALDLDIRHVLVLAVVPEPDESLRDELKFESCDGFLVMSHEDALLFGSSSLERETERGNTKSDLVYYKIIWSCLFEKDFHQSESRFFR